jgi:hypothetical protein
MNKKISSWKPNTRRPKRYPKDPILIVCEDSCVSQTYFNILKNEKRLNYVDIPARKGEGISLTRYNITNSVKNPFCVLETIN